MPENHYSSAEKVIQYTGVRPSDLDFTTDEELSDLITEWLIEIKDFIDRDRNRDYHTEAKVPPGIHNIALRMAANMVAQANLRRSTPVVKVDDFSLNMVEDQVFTSAIRRDLMRYPKKPMFSLMRVRRSEEMPDGD